MGVVLKDNSQKDVVFNTEEFVEIRGVVFKISSVAPTPPSITLEPANVDQAKRFHKDHNENKPVSPVRQ